MARVAEPFRDRLATLAVRHGLARVVYDDMARDVSGALAVRSTEHVEGVRSLVIALLRSALGTTITVAVVLAGLATLVPLVALIVLLFLAAGLAGYFVVLRHLVRGQRAALVAEETRRRGQSSATRGASRCRRLRRRELGSGSHSLRSGRRRARGSSGGPAGLFAVTHPVSVDRAARGGLAQPRALAHHPHPAHDR